MPKRLPRRGSIATTSPDAAPGESRQPAAQHGGAIATTRIVLATNGRPTKSQPAAGAGAPRPAAAAEGDVSLHQLRVRVLGAALTAPVTGTNLTPSTSGAASPPAGLHHLLSGLVLKMSRSGLCAGPWTISRGCQRNRLAGTWSRSTTGIRVHVGTHPRVHIHLGGAVLHRRAARAPPIAYLSRPAAGATPGRGISWHP